MPELIKIARRERAAGEDGLSNSTTSISALREALRDARSLLPSLDPTKNTRFKLGVILGWGVPSWYALATLVTLQLSQPALFPLLAVFFVAGLVGPFAMTFLAAFGLTGTFYALQGEDTRSRLRQALVCPYCRDEVARDGTVICARKGCGALYHDECWRECAQAYGGCAIYGCSSRKCREVSAAGYSLRLARLALAAVLFPPRVARAITSSERESFLAVYRRAVRFSNGIAVSADPLENPPRKMLLYLLGSFPVALVLTVWLITTFTELTLAQFFFKNSRAGFYVFGLLFGLTFVMPRIFALGPALVYYTYRSVAEVLRSEVAALARGDQGGGTVLGRLAAGFGKKSVV
jgi:hypothetical protein